MNAQETVQSQYLAALKMLKEAIVKCPPSVWNARADKDKFWFKVQHVLYWAHVDVRATSVGFKPWKGHGRPVAGRPASREQLLQYLAYIEEHVARPASRADLISSARSGAKHADQLGRAIASIRHIQQHVGELSERLGTRQGTVLHWTESVRRKRK
jgi:hypothetical protein